MAHRLRTSTGRQVLCSSRRQPIIRLGTIDSFQRQSSTRVVSSSATRRFLHTSEDDGHPLRATKERIRQDHNYCVEFVRDRDREGYCTLLYFNFWSGSGLWTGHLLWKAPGGMGVVLFAE